MSKIKKLETSCNFYCERKVFENCVDTKVDILKIYPFLKQIILTVYISALDLQMLSIS